MRCGSATSITRMRVKTHYPTENGRLSGSCPVCPTVRNVQYTEHLNQERLSRRVPSYPARGRSRFYTADARWIHWQNTCDGSFDPDKSRSTRHAYMSYIENGGSVQTQTYYNNSLFLHHLFTMRKATHSGHPGNWTRPELVLERSLECLTSVDLGSG